MKLVNFATFDSHHIKEIHIRLQLVVKTKTFLQLLLGKIFFMFLKTKNYSVMYNSITRALE